MRVYAEPDTEESELGFSLFCVRKWAEIWGGDNMNVLTSLCFFLERYALEIRNDLIEF